MSQERKQEVGWKRMKKMNNKLLIAGILACFAAFIHAFAGEFTDINSLLESEIPEIIKLELRSMWHIGSITFVLSGIVIIFLSLQESTPNSHLLLKYLSMQYILSGIVIILVLIITNIAFLFVVPQWIILLCIGALVWWGSHSYIEKDNH